MLLFRSLLANLRLAHSHREMNIALRITGKKAHVSLAKDKLTK